MIEAESPADLQSPTGGTNLPGISDDQLNFYHWQVLIHNSGTNLPNALNPLLKAGFSIMLTQEDENFIMYWSEQRLNKKKFLRKTSLVSPLGVFMVLGILISVFSGWYTRANMVLYEYSSLIVVVIIAGFGIIAFITIFSAQHKWDQNELHYQELLRKKQQEAVHQDEQKTES